MASLLDTSLLNEFSNIFVILFVFTAVYAVLMFKHPFGDNKSLNALLAFSISLLFIFSQDAVDVIRESIPWYIIMMIALTFASLVVQSIGSSIPQNLVSTLTTAVVVIGLGIILLNVSLRVGQTAGPFLGNSSIDANNVVAGEAGDVGSSSFNQNLGATIFHPKVLGMMLVLVVSLFAVLWIGYSV